MYKRTMGGEVSVNGEQTELKSLRNVDKKVWTKGGGQVTIP